MATITNTDQNHVHIGIEIEKLASSIKAKIRPMPSSRCCIHKVPTKFRVGKEGATFEPQIISVGPLHHGNQSLLAMEEHKKFYLHAFLDRSATTIQELVKAIWVLEFEARACYEQRLIDHLSKDEFIEMMLLDGCFILELLHRYYYKQEGQFKDENDLILEATWTIPSISQDLILLENQIPFIVLEALFNRSHGSAKKSEGHTLNELVASLLDPILPTTKKLTVDPNMKGKHLLDFLRNHLLPSSQDIKFGDYPSWEYTKCATNLSEAGVKFKKKDGAKGLLDISFRAENGVLEIPPFFIGSSMTVLLANLVVLEQCQGYDGRITSYVVLLDSLINSAHDVKLLRDGEIIDCFFHEDEKVAILINSLPQGAFVSEFHYDGVCNRVNVYCRSDWHKWRATLKHDYFNNPWAIISFVAAIVLLFLTLTQAVFSVLSYPALH